MSFKKREGGDLKDRKKNLFNQPQLYNPSLGLADCGEGPQEA